MITGKALNGKPYAGNPHVRFEEGEVASAATPRRGSLLYKTGPIGTLPGIAAFQAARPRAPQLKTGNIGIGNTSTLATFPATPNHADFAILPASGKQEKKQAETETDRDPSRHLARQVVPVAARAARNKPRMGKHTLCETTKFHREDSIKIIQFYRCPVITNLV